LQLFTFLIGVAVSHPATHQIWGLAGKEHLGRGVCLANGQEGAVDTARGLCRILTISRAPGWFSIAFTSCCFLLRRLSLLGDLRPGVLLHLLSLWRSAPCRLLWPTHVAHHPLFHSIAFSLSLSLSLLSVCVCVTHTHTHTHTHTQTIVVNRLLLWIAGGQQVDWTDPGCGDPTTLVSSRRQEHGCQKSLKL